MNNQQIYLNEAHKAACEKALALQANQSPRPLSESIKQAKDLASLSPRQKMSDTSFTEPYAPLKNSNYEAA